MTGEAPPPDRNAGPGNGHRGTGRRRPLRMLHTSDVHLGAHDYGNGDSPKRASMQATFRSLIDLGLREEVDLFVIAGDFFDNARVYEETMRFAAEEIARLARPTVLLPGNHDHVGPGSVYDRLDLTALAQNLHLMRNPEGETVVLEELDVALWGRSHIESADPFEPFAAAPPRADIPWHIGIGHGHYLHPDSGNHPSYHIYEEHLSALDHDYVALGHWEQQVRVAAGEVLAAYSGAPEGLGSVGGRALVVDLLDDGSVRLTSHSLNGEHPLLHDEIPLLQGGLPAFMRPPIRRA